MESVDSEYESESATEFYAKLFEFISEQTDPNYQPSSQGSVVVTVEKPVPFRYNPLHDFESVLWLSFYLLLAVELKNIGDLTPYQVTAQHILAYILFYDLAFRIHVIQGGVLTKNLTGIHPRITRIIQLVDTMREHLTYTFYNAEAGLSELVPFSAANRIEQLWREPMEEIVRYLQKEDITVEPRAITPLVVQEPSADKSAAPWAAIGTQANDDIKGRSASKRLTTK